MSAVERMVEGITNICGDETIEVVAVDMDKTARIPTTNGISLCGHDIYSPMHRDDSPRATDAGTIDYEQRTSPGSNDIPNQTGLDDTLACVPFVADECISSGIPNEPFNQFEPDAHDIGVDHTSFQSPPKVVQHVDVRAKAENRKMELEELRRLSLAKPKGMCLLSSIGIPAL